jgi:hypothetical protein
MTENETYNRKIFLKALPTDNTIGFYKKYGMNEQDTPHGLIPFTRQLSVDSIDSTDKEISNIGDNLQQLIDNINTSPKNRSPKNTSPKKITKSSADKKSQESPQYFIDIDKYKEQKIKNKIENRKTIKDIYNLRKSPAKSSLFLKATKTLKDYNKHLNKPKTRGKKSIRNKNTQRK